MIASSRKTLFSTAMQAFCIILALGIVAGFSSPARAIIEPVPLASDPRVKTMVYGADQVYKYTGYIRYQTSIEFAPDETIGNIVMGDQTGWKLNPMGSKLFLKPTDLDVTTNMTLITNKHTYLFEMHAEEAKSIDDPRLTFILRFVYPDEGGNGGLLVSNAAGDRVPDLENDDLSKYNFRYSITGSQDISPIRIFDDGEFTFFEFRGINADLPAFYKVDDDGNESLINYRMRGNYLVVERVSGRYTLRHGNQVVCVFNDAWGNKSRNTSSSWFGNPTYARSSSAGGNIGGSSSGNASTGNGPSATAK